MDTNTYTKATDNNGTEILVVTNESGAITTYVVKNLTASIASLNNQKFVESQRLDKIIARQQDLLDKYNAL